MAVDPGTAAIVASSLLLAKGPLNKLLGPTLDYFGKELGSFAKKRTENIGRIFQKAIKKLGSKIDEPGQVHPKLLKSLILDGSFCDDELTAEYYGGVLASSRSGVNRDDRGATYLDQISRLSTYQIRTHFIIYTVIKNIFQGTKLNIGEDRTKFQIYIPHSDYNHAMAFDEKENATLCRDHSLTGLNINGLARILYDAQADILVRYFRPRVLKFPESGMTLEPSIAGADLYLWSTGHGDVNVDSFLNPEIKIEVPTGIEIPSKAFALTPPKESQQTKP